MSTRSNRQEMSNAMANLRRRTMSPTQALITGMEHGEEDNQAPTDQDAVNAHQDTSVEGGKTSTKNDSALSQPIHREGGTHESKHPSDEPSSDLTNADETIQSGNSKNTDVSTSPSVSSTAKEDPSTNIKADSQKVQPTRSSQESRRSSSGKPKGSKSGAGTTSSTSHDTSRFSNLKAKMGKQRVEDTHTRRTFLVRNDLSERLDSMAEGTHGFIIEFINLAVEMALDEFENGFEEAEQ